MTTPTLEEYIEIHERVANDDELFSIVAMIYNTPSDPSFLMRDTIIKVWNSYTEEQRLSTYNDMVDLVDKRDILIEIVDSLMKDVIMSDIINNTMH